MGGERSLKDDYGSKRMNRVNVPPSAASVKASFQARTQ